MRQSLSPPLRAAIFDFDGTIAETIPICIAAYQHVIEGETGRRPAAADVVRSFGPSEDGMFAKDLGKDQVDRAMAAFLVEYERLHHEHALVAFPGASGLFAELRARGIHLGIVTGKGGRSLEISLRVLGLRSTFDALECGSPDGGVKVAGLRRLLERWQVPGEHAVYVGDMPSDVHDAHAAGVRSAAATWASNADRDALLAANPGWAGRDFAELASWLLPLCSRDGNP